MLSFIKSWGEYPPEYNREIHGPYNPGVYYGKRDTPFGEVKLGDLTSWLSRRKMTPRAMAQAISRGLFSYRIKWMATKRTRPYFIYHFCFLYSSLHYFLDYKRIKGHRLFRYH